jgi:hypothetical protein
MSPFDPKPEVMTPDYELGGRSSNLFGALPSEIKLGNLIGPKVRLAFFKSPDGPQQAGELGYEAER